MMAPFQIQRSRGFTLLELTVTLLILGILAASGIPLVQRSMEKQNLNVATQRILSELQSLRNSAQLENCRIRVTPNLNQLSFTVVRYNSSGGTISTSTLELSDTTSPIAQISSFTGPVDAFIEFTYLGDILPPAPRRFTNSHCVAQFTLISGESTASIDLNTNLNRLSQSTTL
jgi:prepilin-type N-terminal cleavage/methylation domain-containing protein